MGSMHLHGILVVRGYLAIFRRLSEKLHKSTTQSTERTLPEIELFALPILSSVPSVLIVKRSEVILLAKVAGTF